MLFEPDGEALGTGADGDVHWCFLALAWLTQADSPLNTFLHSQQVTFGFLAMGLSAAWKMVSAKQYWLRRELVHTLPQQRGRSAPQGEKNATRLYRTVIPDSIDDSSPENARDTYI